MAVPHRFPSLIDGQTIQTVLIAGAGLSVGYVPLAKELERKLANVATNLEIDPAGDFYELAETVLESLVAGGKLDADSRLWLAEELGLLDDRRWFGDTGLPLSGNTPRHRAIARFAVEERLRAIVSLNWDTLLEAALDSVGLAEGDRSPRPWKITARTTCVDDVHMTSLKYAHIFPVIKPHGCVRNLELARRQLRDTGTAPLVTFKLKQSELTKLPAGQTHIDQEVVGYVAKCPLIAVGWRAGEGYLRDAVAKSATAAQHTEQDAFTLIDLIWDQNHTIIASAYGKNNNEAFAKVKVDAQPTTDDLFQWLQARYALNKLMASSPADQATLQFFLQQLDEPVHAHFIVRWVDSWLPTWIRVCWRAGVMHGIDPHTNKKIECWDIPIMPRDVHVPLAGMTVERRELLAAAKLLVILGNTLNEFDFEKFPGGFWSAESRKLYIPLPGWRGAAHTADLAALKPLIEALRGLGFIRNIHLVWLDTETVPPSQKDRDQLAAQVRRLMPLANFAAVDALSWIDLEALKGAHDEAMA